MALPGIFVTVGAKIDGFEKSMGDVSKRLNAIDREASRAFSGFEKVGQRLSTIGTGLTAAITLPLAAAGVVATKFAVDFESEMRKVTSLLGGATQQEFTELNKKVLEMSRSLGIDAVGAAKAVYEAISAGIPKENVIDFVTQASKTAIAGVTDTKVAVDALTTIVAAYGLSTSEANKVSDAMFQAVNVGKFQFEDLAKAIGPAAQQASNLGISYQELLAATATLSITSGGVSIAVTQIESAMRALLDPSKEMQAGLKAIGFETGSAAIKAIGFEATLEKLRATTGGSAEAFNKFFGRIEGANAALGLTGPKAATAAQGLDILKHSSDGVGATQKALDQINQSTTRQFAILTAQLKVTAIEMGTALLPAVNALLKASQPLIDMLARMTKAFAELPQSAQMAILSVLAFAAAAGPVILAAGSIVKAIGAIGAASTSLAGVFGITATAGTPLAAALAGIATAAGVAAVAIAALGVAWAAWKYQDELLGILLLKAAFVTVVEWTKYWYNALKDLLHTIGEFGNAVPTSLTLPLNAFLKVLTTVVDAYRSLTSGIRGYIEWVKGSEAPTKSTAKSTGDYAANLLKAAGGLDEYGRAIKKTASVATQAAVSQKELDEAVKKSEAAYKAALRSYDQGKISLEKLTAAQVAFTKAQDAADPERMAKRQETAIFAMLDRWEEASKASDKINKQIKKDNDEAAESYAKLAQADRDLTKSAKDYSLDLGKAHEAISDAFKATEKTAMEVSRNVVAYNQPLLIALKNQKEIAAAYERFGLTAPEVMRATVEANRKAWETISKDAGVNSVVALEAWIKLETSKQDAARRSGQVIPEEQRKALDKAQEQLDRALGKQTSTWGQFTKQVSTIINDFAKDLARGTVDLIKNLFDFDGFNKKLREDSEKLRDELAERGEALEQFRTDTAKKIADAESGYAVQLAKETGEIQSALAERTAEYEQYVEEVAVKLETLRNVEAERLANEVGDLSEKLRDKEYVYEEYLASVGEKEKELRDSHAERLAEQLDNLRDNLRDRTQSYEDFVNDSNEKLGRIGADLAETVEDATRSSNRRMEDENTDFARDQEKLNEDILKAEKKGDKEQVKDLRRTLAQRVADHDKAVRRMREDIAEQVDDAKQRAREQTDDLNRNLLIRTRDHKAFIAENLKDQETLTAKNRESLAQQLGDLQANVTARTAELLKFREETDLAIGAAGEKSAVRLKAEEEALQSSLDERRYKQEAYERDTADKIDALTVKYIEKQAEEVAGLNLAFADKLKEYDKYRVGVEQKLLELEEAHKGPLDRIKDMFKTVFDSAAEAILRVASEQVIGVLIGKLRAMGDLLGGLLGIGGSVVAGAGAAADAAAAAAASGQVADAIGGVAGAAGGVAGAAGGVSGGAGGATGGAASGALGTVSAITGIVTGAVSAISGVIGNFQFAHMNTALGKIEENTRKSEIHLEETLKKANKYWPNLELMRTDDFYKVTHPWMVEMSELLRDGTNSALADIRTLLVAPLVGAKAEAGLFGDGKMTVNLTVDGRVLSNVQIGLAELAGAGV